MVYCIHDLDTDACGTCHPPPVPPLPDSSLRGPWFPAARPGECDGCGDDIRSGDEIRADGEGGWLCETCGDDDQGAESAPPPAPVTAMTPAELRRRFEEGFS